MQPAPDGTMRVTCFHTDCGLKEVPAQIIDVSVSQYNGRWFRAQYLIQLVSS